MRSAKSILVTKITPPQLKKNTLQRQSLNKRLKQVFEYPLTIVQSGPGYGKSTALSSFFRMERIAVCWYSCGEREDDLVPFYQYLVHAIRTQYPGFGEQLMVSLLEGAYGSDEQDLYVLSDTLMNELTQLSDEVIVVIDDFHLVEHCDPVSKSLEYMVRHLPPQVHLVISGRTKPRWDSLTSMKVKAELLELGESDLAFTAEEIDVLFADYYELPLGEADVKEIFRKTEGWVMAVQMIWQQLTTGRKLAQILDHDGRSMDDLFRYLAMEVFSKQTEEIREALLMTCIFDDFHTSLCDKLYGWNDSHMMLDRICGLRLFLFQTGEQQYRYHAMFREFLVQRLKSEDNRFRSLHKLAAQYFMDHQQPEAALYHYRTISDQQGIAAVLHDYGKTLVKTGRLGKLLELTRTLPEPLLDRYPWLWVYQGEAYRYRCLYDKAQACYKQAKEIAGYRMDETGDGLIRAAALEGQARVYLDTIQPRKADALLKESLNLIESLEDSSRSTHDRLRLYSLLAENLVNSGRAVEARKWVSRCRELDPVFKDDVLEIRMNLRSGKLAKALRLLEKLKLEETVKGGIVLSRSHRELNILASLMESMLGNPEKAKAAAQEGMLQGIRTESPFAEACGWMRMGHAAQLMPSVQFDVVLNCYRTAQEMMEGLEVSRGKAEPLMGLCLLHGRAGTFESALQYGRLALLETEQVNDSWLSAWIRLSIAVAYIYHGKLSESDDLMAEAELLFGDCGDSYGLTVALLWRTWIAYHSGREREFHEHLERFLSQMQSGDYEYLVQKRTLFGPKDIQQLVPMLIAAQNCQAVSHYASFLLSGLGLEQAAYHPGYTLRVQTLGEFKVFLGDKELTDKDWQRGKAKELFQLLVVKRKQLVPKEEIMALLYPELDEKAGVRDFKVALNALHSALEPGRQARSNPFFVQRHGTSYGLNLAPGLILDVVEFEAHAKNGLEESDRERAAALLDKGLQLYHGDYMPDRRYDDWCIEERERIQVLYLRSLERMAQLCVESGQFDRAIHWCERIVQTDACWEEAYRLLMYCHYKQNNRNQALKWYYRCCKELDRELGVAPMERTRQMYDTVMQTHVTDL
ncbi:BTAD domain-containing putative transcriptional regulator [Paenibacillus sedimenti]|uniref:Transcriptional regulator n=1 Tax=Paenibacillus sedimenti TaxID=2770274 RepID=A0A926KKU9_9BACL|nr:BTAD domain-containing putative transcriptional regulator [Paenibacillus sedimenti]MBD0378978.1 transcriptional regulator [Paenibacillus sedimenti]